VQRIDPKAEPKLPLLVKGNEQNFAVAADEKPLQKAALEVARQARENLMGMGAPRPHLFPRLAATRPRPQMARPPVSEFLGAIIVAEATEVLAAVVCMVDLTYRIELRSFELSVTGNTLTCEVGGGFHCEGKAVQAGPAPPVPPNVRDITIKLTVTKELEWG